MRFAAYEVLHPGKFLTGDRQGRPNTRLTVPERPRFCTALISRGMRAPGVVTAAYNVVVGSSDRILSLSPGHPPDHCLQGQYPQSLDLLADECIKY